MKVPDTALPLLRGASEKKIPAGCKVISTTCIRVTAGCKKNGIFTSFYARIASPRHVIGGSITDHTSMLALADTRHLQQQVKQLNRRDASQSKKQNNMEPPYLQDAEQDFSYYHQQTGFLSAWLLQR